MPPIYEVTVFSEEDDREIYREKVIAVNEDTAIDQTTDVLDKKVCPMECAWRKKYDSHTRGDNDKAE